MEQIVNFRLLLFLPSPTLPGVRLAAFDNNEKQYEEVSLDVWALSGKTSEHETTMHVFIHLQT